MLTGKVRHELSCAACGAPLHNLKMLPKEKVSKRRHPASNRGRSPYPSLDERVESRRKPVKAKKGKRRKGLMHRFLEEAFDVVEDIFD